MRERWPAAVRRRASELIAAGEQSPREIARTLDAEMGAAVPLQTVHGWSKSDRLRQPPADVPRAIDELSARTVALLDRELAALERHRGRVDLARVERVARALSVLRRTPARDGKVTSTNGARTLADLETSKGEIEGESV
jgi:hypothetical protein